SPASTPKQKPRALSKQVMGGRNGGVAVASHAETSGGIPLSREELLASEHTLTHTHMHTHTHTHTYTHTHTHTHLHTHTHTCTHTPHTHIHTQMPVHSTSPLFTSPSRQLHPKLSLL